MLRMFALLLGLALGLPAIVSYPAMSAQIISGNAFVVDGDTLEIDGRQLRLLGIDAPEAAQILHVKSVGKDYLGRGAALVLRSLIHDRHIRCEVSSQDDQRGTALAVCFSGKTDLGAEMVARGMAWATTAYPSPYSQVEQEAQRARRGLWRDEVERPWQFRKRRLKTAVSSAPQGCAIKGKRDRSGMLIYLAPWSPWYNSAEVNETKGDRWFCSEAEAVSNGWKEPRFLMTSIVSGAYNP